MGHTLNDLACKNAECLNTFIYQIFKLKFKQDPDYEKLKQMLTEALSDK